MKTTDVVFVFPPAPGNSGVFKNHLGVAYLRTALAQHGIGTVQYQNKNPGTIQDVATDLLTYHPRIVGFTVYDANFSLAVALTREIKRQRPNVQVIFGGPSATFGAVQILERHDVVDLCVLGEAEETGAPIFEKLLGNSSLDETQRGVAFRQAGTTICTGMAPLAYSNARDVQSALDVAPSPYLAGMLTDGRTGILTGRGCTYHCQYCCFAALARRKLRLHSIERVIAELQFIAEHQKRANDHYMVSFLDDTFTILPARAKALCQAIADQDLKLTLSCITRADTVDDEMLRLMHEAGFVHLVFGLESAVPSVLRAIGKVKPPDWNNADLEPERKFVEQVRAAVIGAKKHGFNVGVSIILGLPTETAEDGASTLRFVKRLPVNFYAHNFLGVFRGTPLWETCGRYGIRYTLNSMGMPVTREHAYDVASLRPVAGSSLEEEAERVWLLTANALYACKAPSLAAGNIGIVIMNRSEMTHQTAGWLAQIMEIGGLVVQIYPALKRSQERWYLQHDRTVINETLVPVRHYVQMFLRKCNGNIRRWRIACSGIDLFAKHRPQLLSLAAASDALPLVDWIRRGSTLCAWCDVSDYLSQPDELVSVLDETKEDELGPKLSGMPIPPGFKYPGRWLREQIPCLSLTRIEVDQEGAIRCCRQADPIGRVGDAPDNLKKRLHELACATEERRGCDNCDITNCPRCPFPGMSDQAYCRIMTHRSGILSLLNRIQVYSELPLIFANLRERIGSD